MDGRTLLYRMLPLDGNGSSLPPFRASSLPFSAGATPAEATKADPRSSFFGTAGSHLFASYGWAIKSWLERVPSRGDVSVTPVAELVSSAAAEGRPQHASTAGPMPNVMTHLAGIRTGAWARRAMLRAHGWWHPQADALAAGAMGWGLRGGLLRVGGTGGSGIVTLDSVDQLHTLMANLLLLAALSNRTAVLPEFQCGFKPAAAPELGPPQYLPANPRNVSGVVESACAYLPARPCWRVEYVTELEWHRMGGSNQKGQHESGGKKEQLAVLSAAEAMARTALLGGSKGSGGSTEADAVMKLLTAPLLPIPAAKSASKLAERWAASIRAHAELAGAGRWLSPPRDAAALGVKAGSRSAGASPSERAGAACVELAVCLPARRPRSTARRGWFLSQVMRCTLERAPTPPPLPILACSSCAGTPDIDCIAHIFSRSGARGVVPLAG